MFLTRLIYASTIGDNFSQHSIEGILEAARCKNMKHNITGVLCFNCDYFLQCLEGPRADVNETYKRILNDDRHHSVVMLDYREIDSRDFSDWSMGYVPSSTISVPINLKFSEAADFNPYLMSGASAYMMLKALKQSVPTL
ncbi:BLUF domain-containing protein [Pseudoalteromonas byunsanensis]|uniref:Blue light sensor protein n=1 Tax=Pseudoalteromonas byunsanensis TaxID=327939 RepID=A0A1S1NAR0_9GAMM|nr:BLUF domain-containing protein [Pseudoalteromonas byunsanensis]OHU95377.1 blue light sensor protein [Pseudoalteromonas byunsanensis]